MPMALGGMSTADTSTGGISTQVTVVIATRNRQEQLLRTLAQLSAPPDRPALVVVDNASSDGTPGAVARDFPDAVVLALPFNSGAAGRTLGARLASTSYVAFSDDDSWWAGGALSAAADVLRADPAVGLLAGHILVGPDAEDDPTSQLMADGPLDEWLRRCPEGRRGVTGFLACAAIVRRDAFLAVGGFDQHLLVGGEEELVALNMAHAGWKLVYSPEVVAHHHPPPRPDDRGRRRTLVRNDLLTAWLRYSTPTVLRRSRRALRGAIPAASQWRALGAALRLGPWALARRAPVDRVVERAFAPPSNGHGSDRQTSRAVQPRATPRLNR